MAAQARAEATRQKIIQAAVDLFADRGYAETGLASVLERADVTKGAFYYHFTSKDALASAIIDEAEPRVWAVFSTAAPDTPALENLIRISFAFTDLNHRDRMVAVGGTLLETLATNTDEGRMRRQRQADRFLEGVETAVAANGLHADVGPRDFAEMLWMTMYGTGALSDTFADDVFVRLARAWRVLLRLIAHPDELAYFDRFLSRTAAVYTESTAG